MPQPPEATWHDKLPLRERMEFLKWLCLFPALTVMIPLRRHMGYRVLCLFDVAAVALGMFVLGEIPKEADPNAPFLQLYALLFLFAGLAERFKRRREMRRGVFGHSYYVGDSALERLPWPRFMRRERRIARFIDPAVCIAVGVLAMPLFPTFALWLIFSALCLRSFEAALHQKQFTRDLDTMDSLLESQAQMGAVERLTTREEETTGRRARDESLPTGTSPDVERLIRARAKQSSSRSS